MLDNPTAKLRATCVLQRHLNGLDGLSFSHVTIPVAHLLNGNGSYHVGVGGVDKAKEVIRCEDFVGEILPHVLT